MAVTMSERPMPTGEGLTFEKVWAMFQETRESQKETDRMFQETSRKFQETDRMLDKVGRKIEMLNEQMGGLHNSFGEMAEHLVAPGIEERFNELGFHFSAVAPGGYVVHDDKGQIAAQVDILLLNSSCIMGVEVKAKVHAKDIEHHVKRLELLRKYWEKNNDKRVIRGAIAGAIFGSAEKQAAIEAGFYVLVQSGDTMKLELPEGFVPREW